MPVIHNYFTARLARPLGLMNLGPNEARILFDLIIGLGSSIGTELFFKFFLARSLEWRFALAPLLLLAANAGMGIYSRNRSSTWRVKVVILSCSLLFVFAVLLLLTSDMAKALFWVMLAAPPIVLIRLIVGLQFSKHKNIAKSIITQHGSILITGGAGYIGTCLIDLLLKKGYSVKVLDRLMYGRTMIADFEREPKFEFVEGDVTDISKLTYSMRGVSTVVHLAGLVGDAACALDPDFTRQMNIISTRMVKDVAQSMGVSRFVFASSCSVYGMGDHELKETDELGPLSLYAQTKIDSENELLAISRDDFFVTVLRFATVFGHSRRPRFDLVGNLFTAQAMNNGIISVVGPQQIRPFVHVNDIAQAIFCVINANPVLVQNQILNVGDTRYNMTILELAKLVQSVVAQHGKEVTITVEDQSEHDRRNYLVSFEKIQRVLGFEAKTTIEKGVNEMIQNFNAGIYTHYGEQLYSNVAMTKMAVSDFYDPMQLMKLYAPLK